MTGAMVLQPDKCPECGAKLVIVIEPNWVVRACCDVCFCYERIEMARSTHEKAEIINHYYLMDIEDVPELVLV